MRARQSCAAWQGTIRRNRRSWIVGTKEKKSLEKDLQNRYIMCKLRLNEQRTLQLNYSKTIRNSKLKPGARFSKGPEIFRVREAIFSSSVSKNGEVYASETSCIKGTSVHIKNMWIKQLCNRKVLQWLYGPETWVSGAFEKRVPDSSRNR